MRTEHTPGPWSADGESDPSDNEIRIAMTGDKTSSGVARVMPIAAYNKKESQAANARLIAAAPDLLAALRQIHASAAESVEWIRRKSGEAIAKATGNE